MKTSLADAEKEPSTAGSNGPGRLPLWLKISYTAFMAILMPVYLHDYGYTNFVYFCDTSLLLTLATIWTGNSLPASMAAVGILIPQFCWCADFGAELLGFHLTGMTSYMFNPQLSLFLRGLSLFHGWLPFLLVYLVLRLGYDRRALKAWTALGWMLCLIAFFLLPAAGAHLEDPKRPLNVNLVYGFNDAHPQTWMPPGVYLVVWMVSLFALAYVPTDWALRKIAHPAAPNRFLAGCPKKAAR